MRCGVCGAADTLSSILTRLDGTSNSRREDCASEDSVVNMDPSAATLFLADAPSAQLDATQRVLDKAPKRKRPLAIADAGDYSD